MNKYLAGLVMAGLTMAGSAIAESHMSEEDLMKAVTARQSTMKLYAFNLGTLGAMARGTIDYNAEAAEAAAGNLVKLSSMNQMAMWPAGSDMGSLEGTKALPALWEDMAGVGEA